MTDPSSMAVATGIPGRSIVRTGQPGNDRWREILDDHMFAARSTLAMISPDGILSVLLIVTLFCSSRSTTNQP